MEKGLTKGQPAQSSNTLGHELSLVGGGGRRQGLGVVGVGCWGRGHI